MKTINHIPIAVAVFSLSLTHAAYSQIMYAPPDDPSQSRQTDRTEMEKYQKQSRITEYDRMQQDAQAMLEENMDNLPGEHQQPGMSEVDGTQHEDPLFDLEHAMEEDDEPAPKTKQPPKLRWWNFW